jgi:hypothetical protein
MGFPPFHIQKERKKRIQNPINFFLVLEVRHVNSKAIFASFSIMLSKEVKVSISSLNFKFMDMTKFSASFNNQ